MNIKILSQNIVNNPGDFTVEQIERHFEDYIKFRLLDFIQWRKQMAVDDISDKEIVDFYLARKIK